MRNIMYAVAVAVVALELVGAFIVHPTMTDAAIMASAGTVDIPFAQPAEVQAAQKLAAF